MTTFNKGDKVRYKSEAEVQYDFLKGRTGTVVQQSYGRVHVKWNDWNGGWADETCVGGSGSGLFNNWMVDVVDIEPINPVATYIVSLRNRTGLHPSRVPFTHLTLEDAEKEALRLANLHKQDFVVLKVVSVAEQPVIPAAVLKKVA